MKGRIVYGKNDQKTFFVDGKEVTEEEFHRLLPSRQSSGGVPGNSLVGWTPICSDALAVHPLDRQEAMDDARRKGVPTDFLPDGRPVLTSRSHRKAYLKAYGFHDRGGGYGD